MDSLRQDVRFGVRSLFRNRGLTAAAVATLALGIAMVVSLFSVVRGVLLRPLPYPDPSALVQIWESRPRAGRERNAVSPADFYDWKAEAGVFESMAAYSERSVGVSGDGDPLRVEGAAVSGDFFRVLGAAAARGRLLEPSDDDPGAEPVVVLGEGLWRRLNGSDPGAVGRTLVVDGVTRRVVGIHSPIASYPRPSTELFIPLALGPEERQVRALHYLDVVGRLGPGVSLTEARERMDALAERLEAEHSVNRGHRVNVFPLHEEVVGEVRGVLQLLSAAAALVLLIACANVANLLLARATARGREMALRVSLGAGRWRLVRQLLTESVLLALAGALAGMLLAIWGIDALAGLPPGVLPRAGEIGLDGAAVGFTLFAALATGLLFGAAPALQGSRLLPGSPELGARGLAPYRGGLRRALVVSQVALALVLAAGSGLLSRSIARLLDVQPGFDAARLLTAGISLPEAVYPSAASRSAFFRDLKERLSSVPGISAVSTVTALPLEGPSGSRFFYIEGDPPRPPGEGLNAAFNLVSPDYFRTMEIPLRRGRDFTSGDDLQSTPVTIVNEAMAERFWPGRDPLGARLGVGDDPLRTIVGVVANVRQGRLDREPEPEMFWPQLQNPYPRAVMVLRTLDDPLRVVPLAREAVRSLDEEMALAPISTGEELVSRSLDSRRLPLALVTLFAGLALLLAAVGLSGVLSYGVGLRTREFGVRLALGAERRSVLGLVLREAVGLAIAGIALGILASLSLAGFLSHLLYGVSATDPATLASVAALVGAVCLLAGYLPARRATRVDPSASLRQE